MKSSKFNVILVVSLVSLFAVGSVSADGLFGLLRGHYVNGSGDLITEERDLPAFTELEINGSFDVFVNSGEDQEVKITIDDNLMELITTRVRGGRLVIKCEESISAHRRSRIEINLPTLKSAELHGSGDMIVRGMRGDDVDISISGSGEIKVSDIETELLTVRVSGSGEMMAEGNANEVSVRVSGSGDVDLRDLIAEDADVRVSGSGDVEVYAEGRFSGRVSGSGDIRIHGNPRSFREKVSGSGDIRRM